MKAAHSGRRVDILIAEPQEPSRKDSLRLSLGPSSTSLDLPRSRRVLTASKIPSEGQGLN